MARNHGKLTALVLFLWTAWAGSAGAAARLVEVSTPNELRFALDSVLDGDVIELESGTYLLSELTGFYDYFFIADPGVRFTIRSAEDGAAVIDGEGSRRLLWLQNSSPVNAGWVRFEGLVFQNGNTSELDAGGLKIKGGFATFEDCVFQLNSANPGGSSGAAAGALLITEESVVQFIRCSWLGNTSDNHGGAMLIGQGSQVSIVDSVLAGNRNNHANHRANGLGGAIHVYNSMAGTTTRLNVSNTTFSQNQAAFVGGAIMAKGDFEAVGSGLGSPTSVTISNCSFVDNIALNDPSVTPNSPTEGGAVMAENNVDIEIYSSRFSGNSAGLGGAVSSFRARVVVEDSVFRDNSAFGRESTSSKGRGGAINSHSGDPCSDPVNQPTGELTIRDSVFETCTAHGGGCIFVAGDTNRQYSAVPGCQMGTADDNRLPVVLDGVTMVGCSVDDVIANHAVGGGLYGLLVDLEWTDSAVISCFASGTDPNDPASSSQGHGGGASLRQESRVTIGSTTFADNWADHEGGALHVLGSEIVSLANSVFVGNEVSPAGNRPATQSEGAALYTGTLPQKLLSVAGVVTDNVFTDNVGLPVFEDDKPDSHECQCVNLVTYDGNTFFNSTYGSDVFRNIQVSGAHTASELNELVVDRGNGNTTDKSPLATNFAPGSPVLVSKLAAAPPSVIAFRPPADDAVSTESFVSWVWNGGCARLDGAELDPISERVGLAVAMPGNHVLRVWNDAACSGTPDNEAVAVVFSDARPILELDAEPDVLADDEGTTLMWNLASGDFLGGLISIGAMLELDGPSGAVDLVPSNSTVYDATVITRQGGAPAAVAVWVGEAPLSLFADGFESGDLSMWSGSYPEGR